ncbi:E4 34K [Bat mastadenovirus WIV13]|uniref:E4 34K n=1 Tax=Bat mastadenovirus WIV13 TaxID=1788435 RepID=A0A1B0UHY3_9ADEN|nr:E4 34K [Bat mastadenovirus WIV13]AMB43041.1 E4 34K [Bat mastadenovirus WIV13]
MPTTKVTHCLMTDSHHVGRVRSNPGCSFFIPLRELVIPWDLLFQGGAYRILKQLGLFCFSSITLPGSCYYIFGYEEWDVHCHCYNAYSLQCLAGKKIMYYLHVEVMYGCNYNIMFKDYRPYVNYKMPGNFIYIGSVMFRKFHLIYIRFKFLRELRYCIKVVSFGDACYIKTNHNMLVIKCISCKNLTDIAAACCRRRIRKLLLKCVKAIRSQRWPLYPSKREKFRIKHFTDLMNYNKKFRNFRYSNY